MLARRGQGARVVAALTLRQVDPAKTPRHVPLHWLSNAFLAFLVDAVTSDGRHIDPYNELATRYADPTLRTIPPRLDMSYWWCDYTVRIPGFRQYHSSLTNWIFRYHERTGNENDRIVVFRAYSMSQIPPATGESEPRDVKAILAKRL